MYLAPDRALLACGTSLLSMAALLGFVQHRQRGRPEAAARWRVVHVGGTAGGVQLLALAAVWERLGARAPWGTLVVAGVTLATWAFFLGPLARALARPRTAGALEGLGAVVAVPAYLALPWLLVP
jgi:hypothetical protein